MTASAVESLRLDHQYVIDVAGTLSGDDWQAPSGCPGWRVQDVVAHMASLFQELVDPDRLPPRREGQPLEQRQEELVAHLRDLPPGEIFARYRDLAPAAIAALVSFEDVREVMSLGGLGSYPLCLLVNAYAFDHYVHIRADLLPPRGPLDRPDPPDCPAQLEAVIEWMVAGIPQMNGGDLRALEAAVRLNLTGPGGRVVTFAPAPSGEITVHPDHAPEGVAQVTSSTRDFVMWGTKRCDWREMDASIEGDHDLASSFCDAIHVY